MKLTPYGKLVRKLRIEGEIRTKEMAEALEVSTAYLSALETGKKNVTDTFVRRVASFFREQGLNIDGIFEAASQSMHVIKIRPSDENHALVAAFARRFPEMPEEKKRKLLELLNS